MEKKLIIVLICIFCITSISCKKSQEKLFVSSTKGAILRTSADTNSKAITTLPFMTPIQVIEDNNNQIFLADRYGKWIKVKSDNNEGWIFSGFLCEFNVEPLLQIAAKYHSEQFNKIDCIKKNLSTAKPDSREYNELKKLINIQASDIKVKKILGNFIVLSLPHTSMDYCGETNEGDALWVYDTKTSTFNNKIKDPDGRSVGMDILYLNNDIIPDFILTDGGDYWSSNIYLGNKNGDFDLNKTISCSSDPESSNDELCDSKKLKEYYTKQ